MRTIEIILMAWCSLGKNKLNRALTVSGITIGVFSIISVLTTISALQNSIESGLIFLGSNVFQFAKYSGTVKISGDNQFRNRRNIDYRTYLTFVQLMGNHADVICPKVFNQNVQAIFANRKTNPNLKVCGTNENFLAANNFEIGTGRNLSANDVEFSRSVCVIGQAAVDRLFPQGRAVKKTIRLDGKEYQVVGIFARKGTAFGGSADNTVMIPITKFFENYGSQDRTINVAVQARNQMVYKRTMDYAIGAFRQARGLKAEDTNDFEVNSSEALLSAFRDVAGVVSTGAFVLGVASLLAAGVGIMNIMLISVTKRTKEIAVCKSLGARQRDVRLQFLFEALFLSLLGAVSGSVLGVTAGNTVAAFLNGALVFPWGWTIISVLFCSGIGIVFGFYPAQKAASLTPIEALRS
jgi:putative ABC transport system permease protein